MRWVSSEPLIELLRSTSMPDTFLTAGFDRHLANQLNDVRPKLIIAVDRPSERYSKKWAKDCGPDCEVIYYTRKRDAHTERARLLEDLRRRHGT